VSSFPGQVRGLIQLLWQLLRLADERGDHRLVSLPATLASITYRRMTLDKVAIVAVVRPGQEIALQWPGTARSSTAAGR